MTPTDGHFERSQRRAGFGLSALFASLYFVQGIAEPTEGMIAQPVRSVLRSWGHSAAEIATFSAILSLPWALKPLYALLTDFVPLFGTRRRSYLLITTALSAMGLLWLYWNPPAVGQSSRLLLMLLIPTFAVAFSDVVIDGLMIEKGKPLGLTGRFQSIQWGAMYSATILAGLLGGYLSRSDGQWTSLLICGLFAAGSWVLVWCFASEPKHIAGSQGRFSETLRELRFAAKSKALWSAGAFVFLWSFNPFSTSILYLHQTKYMNLSEQNYGVSVALLGCGAVAATACYGWICVRMTMKRLVHMSILLGVVSTLAYWFMTGATSAGAISVFVGFTYMLGSLVLYDLAARACPNSVAATAFACLMSLSNLSFSLSSILGGELYDWITRLSGPTIAFYVLVAIGAAANCLCWLVVPWLQTEE